MSDTLTNVQILKALGLSLPSSQGNPLRDLWNKLENVENFADFQNKINNISTFDEFENYLKNELGFTPDEAKKLRKQIENNFDSFSDFQTTVINSGSYDEFENELDWGRTIRGPGKDSNGRAVSGIRFHSTAGITKDGVSVPAGTTEIFGQEVHFSRGSASGTRNTDDSTSDSGDKDLFSWSNVSVSDTNPKIGEVITVSGTVSSSSDYQENYLPVLMNGNNVVRQGNLIRLNPQGSQSVSLGFAFPDSGTFEIGFQDSSTVTVDVEPRSVGGL